MGFHRKIVKLLTDEKYYEFKWKIKKYKIDVANYFIDMLSGDTLLHRAAETGQVKVMKFLLKKGANVLAVNNDLEIPLHKACRYVLSCANLSLYSDIAHRLLMKCPDSVNYQDRWSVTPIDLISKIEEIYVGHSPINSDAETKNTPEECDDWYTKLSDEMENEYFEIYGCYENDRGHEDNGFYENYDEWAERIGSEYKHKHTKINNEQYTKKQKSSKHKGHNDANNHRPNLIKLDSKAKKASLQEKRIKIDYEKRWNLILKSSPTNELKFIDIPWPNIEPFGKSDTISEKSLNTFFHIKCPMSEEEKKYIKHQQVRWHPDRFLQKIGHSLNAIDRNDILLKVKEISQIINKIISESCM